MLVFNYKGGASEKQQCFSLLHVLLNQKRDLVIIMVGTNDLGMGVSPQAILADVVRLHKACHARGIPTIALAQSTVAQGLSTMGRQQFASLLRKWAKTTDMMELIPLGCTTTTVITTDERDWLRWA